MDRDSDLAILLEEDIVYSLFIPHFQSKKTIVRAFLTTAVLSAAASTALAQVVDCGEVLRQKNVIDTRDYSFGNEIIDQMKSDICSRDFESQSAAESYARNGGSTVGVFDLFDFSISDAKDSRKSVYSIKDSNFCSKSTRSIAIDKNLNFHERIGQYALSTFQKCVETTQSSGLWMTYDVIESGEILVAKLMRKATSGTPLGYEITDLDVSTTGDAEVTCTVNNDELSSAGRIPINAGTARFTCTKTGGGAAVIDLRTNISEFSLVMPSQMSVEQREIEALAADIAALTNQVGTLNKELGDTPKVETGFLTCPHERFPVRPEWTHRQAWNIQFKTNFRLPPAVTAAVAQIESYSTNPNDAWAVDIGEVSKSGAAVSFRAAHADNSFSNCRIHWVAVGH